ncbi:MAG: TRAP transporter small permease subunit [Verrucomicrobiota bacterium]
MNLVHRIPAGIDRITLYAFRGAAVLTLVVVLVGAFNAVARFAGRYFGVDASSNGLIELQWYLFGALFLLAGAEALKRNAHVRVDVLHSRLSARARVRIDLAGHLLFLLPFCLYMIHVSC